MILQKQHRLSRCVLTLIKPLRIFQFFTVLLVFAFTIYMIVMDPMPISALACILLIVLSGVYVFVLAVELINHFAGNALHVIPMIIFSLLGILFFGVAGILFIVNVYAHFVIVIVAMSFCLLAALLFLIDFTMVLAFWKRRCSACKQCCSSREYNSLQKEEGPSITETNMRHDAMTSLSDIRIPRELEAIATPDHTYRKVEYPRRRAYVDCSTCVPSLCNLGVAQIQTDPRKVSGVESQTLTATTKEKPIQTLSKCEFCQQQIQLASDKPGAPSTHYIQNRSWNYPQWSYPAIVQFVRGGVNGVPCCPGCKCTGTAPTQQQQQQQSKESMDQCGPLTPKVESNASKILTSEATQEVANAEKEIDDVTRLTTMEPITSSSTVASFYGPEKRIQTVPDLVYKQKLDALKVKNAKPTNEDVNRKFTEEPILKHAKTRKPETLEETFLEHVEKKRRSEDNAEESKEETIDANEIEKIERNRGGGEYCFKIYQEFMRAAEQGSVTNLETSMHTSGTLITPPSGRTKPRALLHLKSNKVDPIKDADEFDEDCTLEKVAMMALDNQAAQESEHLARTKSPNLIIEHQLNDDACSLCSRQKDLTPTSDNSRCYSIFKDKKGKYFCEFCAPLDSKKITSRLEGVDLRKLRCTNCRLHLRDRSVRTNVKLKSDSCPICGRSQRHAASPSST